MTKFTPAQNTILSALSTSGAVTKAQLHEMTGIRKSSLTRTVEKLHQEGELHVVEDAGMTYISRVQEETIIPDMADAAQKGIEEAQTEEVAPKRKPKWQQALDLIESGQGATIDQIANTLGIGTTAARSLIGDIKRKGYKVEAKGGWYFPPEA